MKLRLPSFLGVNAQHSEGARERAQDPPSVRDPVTHLLGSCPVRLPSSVRSPLVRLQSPWVSTRTSRALGTRRVQFYDRTAQVVWNQFMVAAWNYVTNITKKNQEEMVWHHFRPCPSSLCSSQESQCRGAGGPRNHTFCHSSRAR